MVCLFPSLQTLSLVALTPFLAWQFPCSELGDTREGVQAALVEVNRRQALGACWPGTGRGSKPGLYLPGGVTLPGPKLGAEFPLSGKHEPDLSFVSGKVLEGRMREGRQWASVPLLLLGEPPLLPRMP